MMVLAAFPLAVAAGGSADPPGQGDPTRFVVGVHTLPAGKGPGDDFHGGKIIRIDTSINFMVVETQNPTDFAQKARADRNSRYVHPDPVIQFIQDAPDAEQAPEPHGLVERGVNLVDSARPPIPAVDGGPVVQFTPNDPSYGSQYGPQQIRADLAWDTTLGSTSAAVCVIDTGVRHTHEDLTGARWLGGHDYVNGDTDPDDDHGHGTHVTGTAAAAINNAKGIAGIGNVGFYHVKALSSTGGGTWSDVASAVTWCADNTIARTVISLSLGGSGGAPVLESAVDYAYNTKGKLIVAASGNDGCSGSGCIGYPAAYPEVVAVSCTTSSETKCGFSSSGPEAEIAAPGSNILSTAASDLPTTNCGGGGSHYSTCSGTSMSTPHVSGAAALVWSHVTGHTNTGLRQCLRDTAQDLGPAGWDQEYGYGEVDAKSLLDAGTSCSGGGGGTVIWDEDFDSGSASGWSLSGLWRVTSCRSFSSPFSLGYNTGPCPPNFDVGTTSGDAISPAISIPAGANPVKLDWRSWHSTEFGTTWDQKIVYISADNGVTWTQLWQEDGTQSTWNARSVDISAYAGSTVKVRFHFNSVDGVANTGEGWYVDDVNVYEVVAVPPGAPQNLDAVAGPGVGQIRLTWSPPTSDGGATITSYWIYRSSGSGYSFLTSTSGTAYTDSGLMPLQTYYYYVVAVNMVGPGSASNTACTKPFPWASNSLLSCSLPLSASGGPEAGDLLETEAGGRVEVPSLPQ